jgi:hypothetical protein
MHANLRPVLFFASLVAATSARAAASISPSLQLGDIVVASGSAGVFRVDPTSGMRALLSNFANAAQGPTGVAGSLAVDACHAIYVTDQASDQLGKLFEVFPDGTRIVRSNATDGTQGPAWYTPFGVGVDADGSILVTDRGAGGGGSFAGLWSVDANSGFRHRVTDYGNGAHAAPEGVTLDANDNILIGDAEGPAYTGMGTDCWDLGDCGALLRVNPSTGVRTLLSDFDTNTTQGPRGEDAGWAVALDTDGGILVVDPFAAPGSAGCFDVVGCGALFKVDLVGPPPGVRTLVSAWGTAAQGTVGSSRPTSVAVGTDGSILVGGCNGTFGPAVCRVDRATGVRTVLSDFQNPAQGPTGIPLSIAVVSAVCDFGPTTTTVTSTSTTTTVVAAETCGDCLDNDGDGLTDFEDPACCPAANTLALTIRKARLAPQKHGGTLLGLDTTIQKGASAGLDPLTQDVFLQIREQGGKELLCARMPASRFVARHGKLFKFLDRKLTEKLAEGVTSTDLRRAKRNVLLHAEGRKATIATPTGTTLVVTVGFRNPAGAEADNRCAGAVKTFRKSGKKGALRFP